MRGFMHSNRGEVTVTVVWEWGMKCESLENGSLGKVHGAVVMAYQRYT